VLATPFLDLSGQISTAGERGLLGLAFDPNYATNGFFYVDLINPAGDAEIRRYHVSSNPNVADAASVTQVITIDQTAATNHKAGWLGFGPDGYLYNSSGDGGVPPTSAQDINSLLGKILRIDVHGDDFPADPARNYAVPADNPFVGMAGADEIFALGLRNPWRPSFDRGLGDFYIADVGNTQYEEIDIGQKGANYGWPMFEGPVVLLGGTPTGGSAVPPIYYYDHSVGQSITGGYVYRGEGEALQGQYFYADFVQGKIFTLQLAGGSWVATDRTLQIVTDAGAINSPSSFGEDARGNLYLVDFDGEVFKLTPTGASADQADTLQGFGGSDLLFGGSGNDTLDGGSGADTMLGGAGSDTADYSSSPVGVTVNLASGLGAGGDAQGDVLGGIENIIGSAHDDVLIGDSSANMLTGDAGVDAMYGADGNDAYFVDNISDAVIENLNQGNDTVYASVNYRLGANVESLVLQGSAVQGYGNALSNMINGTSADNLLDGDTGADAMYGGAGNDAYFVDTTSDQVIENSGEGNDTVYASVNYRLGANVEYLVLQGGAIQGYGNGLANALSGTSADNLLDGGAGIDAMYGGDGNDAYFVDNINDVVIENLNEGNDTVYASVDYRLGANLEYLVLQGSAVQGYGNALSNVISGTSADNLLDGGAAIDAMYGGDGNDAYFVDNMGDVVIENLNEGNDTVYASIDYRLGANVENLVLQGGAIQGYGNGLANALSGTSDANLLNGGGGGDFLTGGGGNDFFVFNAGEGNGDIVADFAGNGAGTGDFLLFVGYGVGATFTNIDATHWQVNYNPGMGLQHDIITFSNGASIDPSDFTFA
jgi:glucose/arabinose dehydrogenase